MSFILFLIKYDVCDFVYEYGIASEDIFFSLYYAVYLLHLSVEVV